MKKLMTALLTAGMVLSMGTVSAFADVTEDSPDATDHKSYTDNASVTIPAKAEADIIDEEKVSEEHSYRVDIIWNSKKAAETATRQTIYKWDAAQGMYVAEEPVTSNPKFTTGYFTLDVCNKSNAQARVALTRQVVVDGFTYTKIDETEGFTGSEGSYVAILPAAGVKEEAKSKKCSELKKDDYNYHGAYVGEDFTGNENAFAKLTSGEETTIANYTLTIENDYQLT